MPMKQTKITLADLELTASYVVATEQNTGSGPGSKPLKTVSIVFAASIENEELDDSETQDEGLFLRFQGMALKENLLKHLLQDDKKAELYKGLNINKLLYDITFFEFELVYYNQNSDQAFKIECHYAEGNTVAGRRYVDTYINASNQG